MNTSTIVFPVNVAAKALTCHARLWAEFKKYESEEFTDYAVDLPGGKWKCHLERPRLGLADRENLSFGHYIQQLREDFQEHYLEQLLKQGKSLVWGPAKAKEIATKRYFDFAGQFVPFHMDSLKAPVPERYITGLRVARKEDKLSRDDIFTLVVADELPLLVPENEGYCLRIFRYSAHTRQDTRIQLAGLVHLALAVKIPLTGAEVQLATGRLVRFELGPLVKLWRQTLTYLDPELHKFITGEEPSWWDWQVLCGSCDYCRAGIAANDDLLAVSGLGPKIRRDLHQLGIRTVRELAFRAPSGFSEKLITQARLQVAYTDSQRARGGQVPPARARINSLAPALLTMPEAKAGDIYLDFENDPLWGWNDTDHTGLIYLAGLVVLNPEINARYSLLDLVSGDYSGEVSVPNLPGKASELLGRRYLAYWGHNREQEQEMFIKLVNFLVSHLQNNPGAHIYHYSEQEKLYLRRLSQRYEMLAEEVEIICDACVDLLKVVQESVKSGVGGYSLKQIEPLYMHAFQREGAVEAGADSVVVYDAWNRLCASEAVIFGKNDPRCMNDLPKSLAELAVYNEYDCLSTLFLHEWLGLQYNREAVHNQFLYRGKQPHFKCTPSGVSLS